ncbi:MAG: hypothetical protein WDN01_13420 [Rhizomicrobium sp.]
MRLSSLIRLWVWTTLLALVAFGILAIADSKLKAATGFGTVDLQSAWDALGFKRIFAAWIARPHAAAAGFGLGFDYLFMPLYAMSFYFSAILAREAFAPKRGLARRAIDYLGFVPLIGALADAVENALEYSMLLGGATDSTAYAAYLATNVKMTCFYVGLALLVAGIVGVMTLRRPKKEDTPSP